MNPTNAPLNHLQPGIGGVSGIRSKMADGTYIGADFIRMEPGASFPLHTHEGDHILYVICGIGYLFIEGKMIPLVPFEIVHVPGAVPHRVEAFGSVPFVFLAFGYPHRELHSPDRMRVELPKTGSHSNIVRLSTEWHSPPRRRKQAEKSHIVTTSPRGRTTRRRRLKR